MADAPDVFISYSHDSPDHKRWVTELASRLRKDGVSARLDQWDLGLGDDVTLFMENALRDSDRVLCICTNEYVRKANAGEGGVGYERLIVTAELVSDISTNRFIPIVRQDGTNERPSFLETRFYVNLSHDDPEQYELLLRALHNEPPLTKPPLGHNPFTRSPGSTDDSESLSATPAALRTDGERLAKDLIEQFLQRHRDRPMLRIACIPVSVPPGQPLRDKEAKLKSLLNVPPRARHSGWYVRPGEDAVRTELGLARIDPVSERTLATTWNGAVVFDAPLDTGFAIWAYEQLSSEGGSVINPMTYLEPLVGVLALMRKVCALHGYSAGVRVDFGFFSAEAVRLTPYLPGSYAIRLRLDRHNPKIIRPIDRPRLAVFTGPQEVADLNDRYARDLAAELFAEVGFDKDIHAVPLFSADGDFTIE